MDELDPILVKRLRTSMRRQEAEALELLEKRKKEEPPTEDSTSLTPDKFFERLDKIPDRA